MFTDICQKVFDFFTIFTDLSVRHPIKHEQELSILCLLSIAFVTVLLRSFGMFLLDIHHNDKNQKDIDQLLNN